MHDGKLEPGQLDAELVNKTYVELNNATGMGYGKSWNRFGEDAGSDKAVMMLRRNLFNFAGAKTFTQLTVINDKLVKDGKRQDWPEFKNDSLAVVPEYNVNHLQAEHQTCTQCGHAAVDWQRFVADIKIFPNVKFKTAGDKRVRESHKALEGLVVAINSEFIKKHMTPLGYRCRCRWIQTAAAVSKNIPTKVEGIADDFLNNVGLSGEVFIENPKNGKPHPYFAIAREGGRQVEVSMERLKLDAPYSEAYKARNGSKVEVSPFADLQDLAENFKTAKVITDELNIGVKIRPHLNRTLVPGKNPEYEIKGRLADRKGIKSAKGVADAIDNAKVQMLDKETNPEQTPYTIVFDLSGIENLNLTELKTALNRKINETRGKSIYSVIMVNGKNAIELLRAEIVKRDYAKLDKIQ